MKRSLIERRVRDLLDHRRDAHDACAHSDAKIRTARDFPVPRPNLRRPARRLSDLHIPDTVSQLGIGAIQWHVLRVFDHMKGRRCQRGSQIGQTGAMVLRLGMPGAYRTEGCLHRAPTADDGRI